jgi:hypothetical protein
MKAIQNGADYCGKKYIKPFLGTHFDNVIVTDHLPNKYEFRIADPRTLGDDEVTADFKGFRLNIRLDQNGIIKSLKCG